MSNKVAPKEMPENEFNTEERDNCGTVQESNHPFSRDLVDVQRKQSPSQPVA